MTKSSRLFPVARPTSDRLAAMCVLGILCLSPVALARQALPTAGDAGEKAGAAPADADPLLGFDAGASPVAELLGRLGPDVQTYQTHIMTLANPFFEGREPTTRGAKLAAEYVEFYFKQFGLQPAFPTVTTSTDGQEVTTPRSSYRQAFTFGRDLRVTKREASYTIDGGAGASLSETDAVVLGFSGNGEVTAPLVFAGYSLENEVKEHKYGSYPEGMRLDGKIALVMRFEPMNAEGKSRFVETGWSPNAGVEPKIQAAIDRGAVGVILINPPGNTDNRGQRLMTLQASESDEGLGAPVVMISTEAASALVERADTQGRSLMDLRKLADEQGTIIDLPKVRVTLKAELSREPIKADNVAGILPGKGPLANEYIVVGGHHDHVGYGYFGSNGGRGSSGKLHPGADDNGSGTAGVLLLAEKMREAYAALPADANTRSIIFATFSAEESGLIGSRHMSRNLPVDKDKVVFMLNMDMIGRLYDKNRKGEPQPLEVSGVDTGEGMEEWVKPMLDKTGLNIKIGNKSNDQQMLFARSDHFSFYQQKVPVLFFFTGLHTDYHAPGDVGWKINAPGAVRIVRLAQEILTGVATRSDRFAFTSRTSTPKVEPKGDAKDAPAIVVQGGADPNAPGAPPPGGQDTGLRGMKVRFGIMPGDYSGQDKGVLVGDVYEGTTASEAGLKGGDLITKWNETELASVEDWMAQLAKHAPGDEVMITFRRDGKEQVTKAKLKARESGPPR